MTDSSKTTTTATATQTTTQTTTACCTDCKAPLVRSHWWAFWEKSEYGCENTSSCCPARLCQRCHGRRPLLTLSEKEATTTQNIASADKERLRHATLKHFCRECFKTTSTIDFEKTYITMGLKEDNNKVDSGKQSDVVFVYVHGGGASRQLFAAHAQELYQRHGHAAVLLDLPGHGSWALKDDELKQQENNKSAVYPLTLETCAETLERILRECGLLNQEKNTDKKKKRIIYVGGSLGAYAGFYLIDKFQHVFDGAILMDCGQNVGPGASLKARLGLRFLKWACGHYSNADLMNMMAGVTVKSQADYKLLETSFGAGMFFDQGAAQVEGILQAVAPAEYIPKVSFPILFFNGSEDYRDSEQTWLDLCSNKKSQLHVYPGGDHFFTHDSRFVPDLLQRMHDFSTTTTTNV